MGVSLAAIDPVAFRIGPLSVYWYGLIIVFGAYLGQQLMMRQALREGMDADQLLDLFFYAVINGFIGARLYYVLFNLDFYLQHPTEIIAIWHGGLAIYGGIIAGTLTIVYFARKYHWDLWRLLDASAPGLMLAQAIGRWGNFMNQEAYGAVVSRAQLERLHLPNWLIEQMYIDQAYRQPTFLYESVWNLIGVGLLLTLRRLQPNQKPGTISCLYLVWYGIGRFFIEGMRSDSLYLGTLRISQVVSLVIAIGGMVGLFYLSFTQHHKQSNHMRGN